ncbi:MAG: glutamine amidotransferase [Verrucomicrobiota bacterium]
MNDLIFHPVMPATWFALAVAAVAAACIWSLWRGVRSRKRVVLLALLRLVALAAVATMLAQPQKRREDVIVMRPQLAVLIDKSESMTDPVDPQQPCRNARVSDWLKTPALEKARKDFDLRFFSFDQGITEVQESDSFKYDGTTSNLLGSVARLEEHFRGQPLAGVLLLSDGLSTFDGTTLDPSKPGSTPVPQSATRDGQSAVPVFAFELEKQFKPKRPGKRVSLAGVDYPPRVVTGWDTEIRPSITAKGMSGQTVTVELWREGRKSAESAVSFNEDDQTRQVAFPVSHSVPGTVRYELRVADNAADKEAKSYPFVVEAMEPGNRVVYLQNTLGFDFKFLRKAIVTDRNLQLSAFVRWADGRLVNIADAGSQNPQSALDLTPQGLARTAVVILGDLPPDALTANNAKALRDYVDRGGGLVLLGGPNSLASPALRNTPLAEMLPVRTPADYREGNFLMQINDTGLHHPVFGSLFAQVKDFPALLTCNLAARVAPTAEVLMETVVNGQRYPVIVAMRFGQGRVIVVLSDTIWRWRLAAKGWSAERSPYDTFWAQLMDWLIPKEQQKQNNNRLELFTDRSNYLYGEHPQVRAILRTLSPNTKQPATLPLQVRTPDEKVFEYTLRAATLQTRDGKQVAGYRADVEPNVPGAFRAKATVSVEGTAVEGETRFIVAPPVTEITGKPINRDLLKNIAESHGGRFYAMDQWNNWPQDLHFKEQHFTKVELIDLWNHPLLLGLILLMLAADWTARKFWNLP